MPKDVLGDVRRRVLGDTPGKRGPGHVHRGALSGPPVRTYPGRPQAARAGGTRRSAAPAGPAEQQDRRDRKTVRRAGQHDQQDSRTQQYRGTQELRLPLNARPDPVGGIRSGIWEAPRCRPVGGSTAGRFSLSCGSAPASARDAGSEGGYGSVPVSGGSVPVSVPGTVPGQANRPGHRALCESAAVGAKATGRQAGWCGVLRGDAVRSSGCQRPSTGTKSRRTSPV